MHERIGDVALQHAINEFVGRESELKQLHDFVDDSKNFVLFVSGIPGVGKSLLLQVFMKQLVEIETTVIYLDGETVEPTPKAFLARIASLAHFDEWKVDGNSEPFGLKAKPFVIVLDNYEHLGLLDDWLRCTFVPSLSLIMRIIIVSRNPPVISWKTSYFSNSIFETMDLNPLPHTTAIEFMRCAGIESDDAENIYEYTQGHPMALKLATTIFHKDKDHEIPKIGLGNVFEELSQLFLAEIPDLERRNVIEASVIARRITQPILSTLL